MGTVVYIPARKNSTRVKDKNIALVGGLPLMAYTIRMALALDGVDHVFVDTDSREYAEIASEYGAEVPFLRDTFLATAKASLTDATTRFLDRLYEQGLCPPAKIITLLPTSPFRNVKLLRHLVAAMDTYTGVFAMLQSNVHLAHSHCRTRQGELFPLHELMLHEADQYDWAKIMGYFIGSHTKWRPTEERALYNNFLYWPLTNPIELVDVDTQEDLDLARRIVDAGLYDFGLELGAVA